MLIKRTVLAGIAEGTVTLAFRRWREARLRDGSTFRTSIGVLRVKRIREIALEEITESAAKRAGHGSRDELLEELRGREGRIFRIELVREGPDPRLALRARTSLSREEREELDAKLARLGARGPDGPWAVALLRLIEANPAVRAPDLARRMGMETRPFKARVRRLKELGLTESLKVGYRLSPRGRAFLRR